MYQIDPRKIKPRPGHNARDFTAQVNIDRIKWHKESFLAVGQLTPLTVMMEDETVLLEDGETRWRAYLELIDEGHDIKEVACQPAPRYRNDAERKADQVVRNKGDQFTQMELAGRARYLVNCGWAVDAIATRWTMTPQNVHRLLELNELPDTVKDAVRAGEIEATTAAATVRQVVAESVAEGSSRSEGLVAAAEIVSRGVVLAKSSGKKKATPKQLNAVRPKPIGKTIRPPEAERVIQFLSDIALADSLDEVKSEASRLLMRILES
jgi:hypothetical protein